MVASIGRPAALSRTSSSTSFGSIDFSANAFNAAEQRRTRKRISSAQLTQLEELYRQSSHPTRDQRDALAKRIQMETKSVTIWFQNKRQTDRKVALHNATNSRNVVASTTASVQTSNATLVAPTLPMHPPGVQGLRSSSDSIGRKQSTARSNALKRISSHASSVTSTSSTTSTSRTRPSLDRVASRSEIRFSEKPTAPSESSNLMVARTSSSGSGSSCTAASTSSSAPSSRSSSLILARTNSTASLPPASPPPSASHPLWAAMLSSPLAPSSPPSAEYVVYTRARKARTLDWACAAARVAAGDMIPKLGLLMGQHDAAPTISSSTLGSSAFPSSGMEAAAHEREYEEATAMTEDEAELVTPPGSQDVSMSWEDRGKAGIARTILNFTPNFGSIESMPSMDVEHSTREMNKTKPMATDGCGWEEDEMHAALALCGLRG